MPQTLFCILAFAGSAGLYLLFAGQLSSTELLTAGLVAAAFTLLTAILRLRHDRRLSLPWPPVRALLRPFASLFADSGRVGLVLLRAILHRPSGAVGAASPQPYRAGGQAPADSGRRALVILGSSLAPNGFVLEDLPDNGDRLVMHRLAQVGPSRDREWPT
jgi:hypothetical protein